MPYNFLAMERRIKATYPKIEKSIYEKVSDLSVQAWLTDEPVSFDYRKSGTETVLKTGDNWGGLFSCAWFNFKGKVPINEIGEYVLIIDLSGEGCIVDGNGNPLQGITTVSSMYDFTLGMPGKKVVYLDNLTDSKGNLDVWLDAGNNDLFGNQKNNGTLVEAYVAKYNRSMLSLHYDFEILNELRSLLDNNKARYHTITHALYRASLKLINYSNDEAENASEILKPELSRKNSDPPLKINAIGHSHIDLAWLWPIRETIRKGARTFSTALMNMEKYPDYKFGASQPQLYQWMKEYYPDLFNRIKKAVKNGRWELQGAMWVESDTNVTGGESLIRQMLYGKKFYKDEFEIDVKNVWLPDVFGYSAVLPQIMKKSDVNYFMTIKISWSEFNKFPHHTFIWKGLDGSEVLVHMPPEGTYNSSAAPRALLDSEEKFSDKGVSDECLLLYGIGDGGGGPGEEHLERLKREKNLQGMAPVKQGFASDFFDRISKDLDNYKTWSGELYLEHHRGTYTSEGRNKKFNKLIENLLRDTEIIGCITENGYDHVEIENIWKEVLLYQFHDILPGSSIKRVYDESCERYAILEHTLNECLKLSNDSDEVFACNTLSWERSGWLKDNGKWKHYKISPLSMASLVEFRKEISGVEMNQENMTLENKYLKVAFNNRGEIISLNKIYSDFEVVKKNECINVISVYKDDGDAWDFPHDYKLMKLEAPELKSISMLQDGPEVKLCSEYTFRNSIIKQETVLAENSKSLEFRTILDWNDKNMMVRSSFPVSVESDRITCGIQFGYIERPSHENTRWDMAKFEVCAHNYVDKSRGEYGVALLSDYKYGFSSTTDTIEINLLRSTGYPDTDGDIAIHEFTYALYPHEENHIRGDVIKEAMELSHPIRIIPKPGTNLIENNSFLCLDCDNVFVETIKNSEDETGIIVRLYEAYGKQTKTKINFNSAYESIIEVNLIEKPINSNEATGSSIDIVFTPFEIKTLLLK